MPSNPIADIQLRAALYAAFSAALREPVAQPPKKEEFEALWNELGWVTDLPPLPRTPKDVEAAFRKLFGHNLSPDCPPYETHYGKMGVFRKSHTLADLAGFYRAFGIELAEGDRRSDHLPVQLEFVAFLLQKEAHALSKKEKKHADICGKARAKFLKEHLAVWIPAFAHAVNLKGTGGYYDVLVRHLEAFVAFDAASLKILEGDSPAAVPVMDEAEIEPCTSCIGGTNEAL